MSVCYARMGCGRLLFNVMGIMMQVQLMLPCNSLQIRAHVALHVVPNDAELI